MAHDTDEQDAVLVERRDGVQIITINRPHAKNALNGAVARGIAAAVDELDADDDLRVGILTGAGGTFSAGMDLKAFLTGDLPLVGDRGLGGITQQPPRKPLIGAVEGWAVAGGFELLLACDLVVASETAQLGVPEVKRALVAGAGAAMLLTPSHPAGDRARAAAHRRPDHRPARSRPRPGQPAHARGRRPRRGPRPGRDDRRQRPPRGRDHQADRAGVVRLGPRGGLGQAVGADGAGLRLRGRPGGRDRVRREAAAGLEGPLTPGG